MHQNARVVPFKDVFYETVLHRPQLRWAPVGVQLRGAEDALRLLAVDPCQLEHRGNVACAQVLEHSPDADGGKLVVVTCKDASYAEPSVFTPQAKEDIEQIVPRPQIDHATLVNQKSKRRHGVFQDVLREFAVLPARRPPVEPGSQHAGVM